MIYDVTTDGFPARVLDRSREVPVVVDFWAEWCGPCRQLGPALEAAVAKRDGKVELAKLDVDANQALAAQYRVQGIPAVKAFRDGQVVDEFVGAVPPARVEAFFDGLIPSEADELARAGDEASLRRALEIDPRHAEASRRLARILIGRGELDEARELLGAFGGDFVADGLAARAELCSQNADGAVDPALESAFGAWDAGDQRAALEALQQALAAAGDAERRDRIRRVMVAIFTELGSAHPLASEHRRRLAAALS